MVGRGGTTRRLWAVLVGAALALAVSSCGAASPPSTASVPPDSTATPMTSASASETVAMAPSSAFEPPAGVLPPRSRAVVTRNGLRVREEPGLAAKVLDTLSAGTVVNLDGLWGPVEVDGIPWYFVVRGDGQASGFIASGSGADRYLESIPPRCEVAKPDLAALLRITAWERVACYADQSLTITGTYGCPVCGSETEGTFEPLWLATPNSLAYLGWPDVLAMHTPPGAGLEAPPNASVLRVCRASGDPVHIRRAFPGRPGTNGSGGGSILFRVRSFTAGSNSCWTATRSLVPTQTSNPWPALQPDPRKRHKPYRVIGKGRPGWVDVDGASRDGGTWFRP